MLLNPKPFTISKAIHHNHTSKAKKYQANEGEKKVDNKQIIQQHHMTNAEKYQANLRKTVNHQFSKKDS